jgi:Flp pilus assembly protein TadG
VEVVTRVMGKPSGSRGAIYVEYAVAIVPLFVLFWGLLQLNGLLLADLVVRDAAMKAVRAAVVCDSDKETSGLSGATQCAQEAVDDTVKALLSLTSAEVTRIDGASSKGNQLVTVTVVGHYTCQVPLVASFVCGAFRGEGQTDAVADIERTASLPNQGHFYNF